MASNNWKKLRGTSRIMSWKKKGLEYPQSEDIAVIKASDGWVVNHAGYNGSNYFSDNILVTDDKKEAMLKATWFMRNN